MSAFSVRPLGAMDIERFRNFRLEALQFAPEAFGASYAAEAAFDRDRWLSWLSEAMVTGCFDPEGRLIGCASLSPGAGEKRSHIGHLGAVYVAPDWRGRGVADALLKACIGSGIGRFLRIILTVNASNPRAVNLYERHGFTAYGQLQGALFVNGVYYDEILMAHELRLNSN